MQGIRIVRLFSFVLASAMVLALASSFALAADTQKRPLFAFTFSGSANQPGAVYKLDPSAGYRFSRHFEIEAGLPIYIVHASDTGIAQGFSSKNGIGNVYLDVRYFVSHSDLYFSSTARGTAPTGSTEDGFSTGRVTIDWSNYLEKDIGRFSPFGNVGIANTISDTHFFNMPFSSLGIVGHLEGGASVELFHRFSIAGSAYAIIPSGEQKVYSKIKNHTAVASSPVGSTNPGNANGKSRVFETSSVASGSATIVQDHGYSGWLDFHPASHINLEVGYSHSISYALDTIFFSAGFDIGSLLSRTNR